MGSCNLDLDGVRVPESAGPGADQQPVRHGLRLTAGPGLPRAIRVILSVRLAWSLLFISSSVTVTRLGALASMEDFGHTLEPVDNLQWEHCASTAIS